jgi:heme oxygenase (biliverdin-IX-beta and delta-forming)
MTIDRPAASFHARLRTITRDAHEDIDRAFGSFRLTDAADYARFLRAHARVLPVAEQRLAPSTLLAEWQPRAQALREDLAQLRCPLPPALPLAAPQSEAARLGALYVVEGSRLGGVMISRSVPADLPRAYLSAAAPQSWRALLALLEGHDEIFESAVITSARQMFAWYGRAAELELAVHV